MVPSLLILLVYSMKLSKKYDFQKREKHWQKYWEDEQIYKFNEKSAKPLYAVDTPPPYVSAAHLHSGHIMSYSQAEFVVRFKRMQGFNVYYPMGFDDNGLPTERYVEKKYDVDKSKISRSEFIKLCLKETKIGGQNYRDLWTSLGISVDWNKVYSTIDETCQRVSQWSFIDLYNKGKVYRKEEPTLWCPFCQTALAQADLEDEEINTKLNYINFQIEGKKYEIATTRPELIPACVAVFAHPDDERYKKFKDKKAKIPIFGHEVPILFDDKVDKEFGTGLMMVCSWGDQEDVRRCKENKLKVRKVIDKGGRMTELAGDYKGVKVEEARNAIIRDLDKKGFLVKQEDLTHTVNVHERCSTPLEFYSTKQWFIKVLDIKEYLLRRGEELNWYPEFMKKRYEDWIEGLQWDWCISRQRYYGVPLPLWYCEDCGEPILADEKKLPAVPSEDAPPIDKCPKCKSENIVPEKDVLDTWATSSCTPFIIPELVSNKTVKKQLFPNSLRPQAFEIIRTWLFYSILKAHYHFESLPFEDVMISGHGLDEKGKKISKRIGNYIEPSKLLEDYGADAVRYWATGAHLGRNHRFDIKEVKKGKNTVNKIWNASRFAISYIEEYEPDSKDEESLEPEDKWILSKLNKTIKGATENFEKYEYSKVRQILDDFFWKTFCDYYIEMVKHRGDESSAKFTLYTCLTSSIKLYAPILPFVTEEIYQAFMKKHEKKKSIHITSWPEYSNEFEMTGEEKDEFNEFVKEIDEMRRYRGEKKIPFGEKIEDYKLQTKMDKEKFGRKFEEVGNLEIC